MIERRAGTCCTLLLLLLVGADLLNPAVPGVFSLGLPQIFLDGAIQRLDRVPASPASDAGPYTTRGTSRWGIRPP
jgi:hypothetical protein